jgi:hypothetical protein
MSCCPADVFKGSADCQQKDSEDEEDDGDALATELEEEDALLEAACDVVPSLARSIGLQAFLPVWKVCCQSGRSVSPSHGTEMKQSKPGFSQTASLQEHSSWQQK